LLSCLFAHAVTNSMVKASSTGKSFFKADDSFLCLIRNDYDLLTKNILLKSALYGKKNF